MNRSERREVSVVGYVAIQSVALAISIVASFVTSESLLNGLHPTSSAAYGNGIGFLAVICISFNFSIPIAIIAPVVAQSAIPKPSAWLVRAGISFLAPILAAIVVSAVVELLVYFVVNSV